ncbi:hypothetical protein BH11PAT2_BH11PAT2_02550 [soil metagenome]
MNTQWFGFDNADKNERPACRRTLLSDEVRAADEEPADFGLVDHRSIFADERRPRGIRRDLVTTFQS